MEISEVEAFLAIAATGSFTAAAGSLQVSQPAISRRVELLEQEFGVRLFERDRGGARLTDAGEAFLSHAGQMLAAARDGAAAVQEVASGERGMVSLALVGTLANVTLTSYLRAFRHRHPDVRLTLRTARSGEVSTLVRQGAVMLGLRYFADESPALVSIPVMSERLLVVHGANRLPNGAIGEDAAELSGIPWVGFPGGNQSSGDPFARLLIQMLVRTGLDDAEIIAVDSLTAQKRLIEAGFGLGLLPESSIEEEVAAGSLRVLDIPILATVAPVHLIHRCTGHLGAAARNLLALLSVEGVPSG